VRGLGVHLLRYGLVDEKDSGCLGRLIKVAGLVIFLATVAAPTWPGESVVLFSALLALSGAWLIAVPTFEVPLSSRDLRLLRRGLREMGTDVLDAIKQEGFDLTAEVPPAERPRVARLTARIAAELTPHVVLRILFGQSTRALILGVAALGGIMAGPQLERFHVGYWSPVAVWYALCMPLAFRLLAALVVPLLLRTYLSALRVSTEVDSPLDASS
jgi:hypothetical protein